MEEEDTDAGELGRWRHDPHTQRLAREAKSLTDDQHERLLLACGRSTDPDVRGAYVDYKARLELQTLLGTGHAKPVRKTPPQREKNDEEKPKQKERTFRSRRGRGRQGPREEEQGA